MINSCQCVPLNETEMSIKDSSTEMIETCWVYLEKLIEELQPSAIIVFGKIAYENLMLKTTNIKKAKIKKLTKCVKDQTIVEVNNIKIIPEVHPSPQNRNNRYTKEIYPDLEKRLVKHICNDIK